MRECCGKLVAGLTLSKSLPALCSTHSQDGSVNSGTAYGITASNRSKAVSSKGNFLAKASAHPENFCSRKSDKMTFKSAGAESTHAPGMRGSMPTALRTAYPPKETPSNPTW